MVDRLASVERPESPLRVFEWRIGSMPLMFGMQDGLELSQGVTLGGGLCFDLVKAAAGREHSCLVAEDGGVGPAGPLCKRLQA